MIDECSGPFRTNWIAPAGPDLEAFATFTFAGSAFPFTYPGATPVFVDSEPRAWNLDPALLEEALTDRTRRGRKPRAVIVVHLYGQPAAMDAITAICARHAVPLIEDAAESLGATHKGRHTGTASCAALPPTGSPTPATAVRMSYCKT